MNEKTFVGGISSRHFGTGICVFLYTKPQELTTTVVSLVLLPGNEWYGWGIACNIGVLTKSHFVSTVWNRSAFRLFFSIYANSFWFIKLKSNLTTNWLGNVSLYLNGKCGCLLSRILLPSASLTKFQPVEKCQIWNAKKWHKGRREADGNRIQK